MKKLDEFLAEPKEAEWLEFKEAKRSFSFDELGKYFSALSNEARLQSSSYGWLIFGIENKNREIVGTSYKNHGEIEKLKHDISQHTTGNLTFIGIYEVKTLKGRILMFQIPPAPQGIPVAWKRHFYGRDGESLVGLSVQEIEAIRGNINDWSEELCSEASIGDLDLQALDFSKVEFTRKYPSLEKDIKSWDDKTFLNKAKLAIKGTLTKTAILLLGKSESSHYLSPVVSRMTWVVKDDKNKELDYEHFDPPFLLASQRLREKIRNLKYRYMPDQTLFPEELLKYDPWVIREALHNCIAHQDYTLRGKIIVVEKPDELIFSNMGSFLPGTIESVIEEDAPPKQYRNPLLVNAMANLNMIDTIGSGIKRMYITQRERFFPLPTFDFRKQEVTVHIHGKILNLSYTKLLRSNNKIDLNSNILLDYVQKGIKISKEAHKFLKGQKLVEGRYPNLHLSSDLHEALDKRAEYIKKRGLQSGHYEAFIIEYLKKFKKASRKDIDDLLLDQLPDVLSREQKRNKVRNLLHRMSKQKGIIYNEGSSKSPVWRLS